MEEQIKPCPFCGSYEDETYYHADSCYLRLFAFQTMEWCGIPTGEYTDDDLVKAWNTRVYPGDETAEYFILPKPKEKIVVDYSRIVNDSNGAHMEYSFEIINDAFNSWADLIEEDIKQKLFETFRPTCHDQAAPDAKKFCCSKCCTTDSRKHPVFCHGCGAKVVENG